MIIQEAKEKIYNSPVIKYVDKEKIEKAFSKIHVYETHEEFLREYGRHDYDGGRLEGFNRNNGSHISPIATPHTIIHEVLHELSSEFNNDGHRIINGIMGQGGEGFANQVNEGLTDYLTAKISGEKPRHYRTGHEFFSRVEPNINKYYEDNEILYELYLNHDDLKIKEFLDKTLKKRGGASNIYENFLYFDNNKIEELGKEMRKNTNRILKKRNSFFRKVINKLKNKSSKVQLLPESTNSNNINRISEFHEQYKTEFNGKIDIDKIDNANATEKQHEDNETSL